MVGGTEGLSDEHATALSEYNQYMYRKLLGLTYSEFLEEPYSKFVWALKIEDSLSRKYKSESEK